MVKFIVTCYDEIANQRAALAKVYEGVDPVFDPVSRDPQREDVLFFDTFEEAEAALKKWEEKLPTLLHHYQDRRIEAVRVGLTIGDLKPGDKFVYSGTYYYPGAGPRYKVSRDLGLGPEIDIPGNYSLVFNPKTGELRGCHNPVEVRKASEGAQDE